MAVERPEFYIAHSEELRKKLSVIVRNFEDSMGLTGKQNDSESAEKANGDAITVLTVNGRYEISRMLNPQGEECFRIVRKNLDTKYQTGLILDEEQLLVNANGSVNFLQYDRNYTNGEKNRFVNDYPALSCAEFFLFKMTEDFK